MILFADTNVLIDYLCRRHPYDQQAELLLFGCAMGDYELWISSSQITDLFFLLTHGPQSLSRSEAARVIRQLRTHVRVGSLTESDVDVALDLSWSDFEDACVYQVARRLKSDYLITRNLKDYSKSKIPVLCPSDFLMQFQQDTGICYEGIAL